nr:hypothetical protein [Stutzerimonas nitrititolerans]
MDERIRRLIDICGIDELVKTTSISGTRWKTVRYDKRTRISTQEVAALVSLYPQYALWIASGEVHPECGQTSPDYDAAHSKLFNQNAG